MTITNSTISGNSASSAAGGISSVGTLTITNSIVSGNSAGSIGGGIFNGGGTVRARNTIIALNTAPSGPDFNGALTSQGFNLIGNGSGAMFTQQSSDQVGVTAAQLNLGPLLDNGGPTKTHALLSGSRAIDAGNSSGSTTDQRGFFRPVDSPTLLGPNGGDGSDIGAYEVQADQLSGCNNGTAIVTTNSDTDTGSLRSAIATACAGSTITFASSVISPITLTSGELLINKPVTINGPGANLLSVQRGASAGNFRIFNVSGNFNATISGLTIANGKPASADGGGIRNNARLTINSATVSGNQFAGIFNYGGTLTLTNSTISDNLDGIDNFATLTITNSTISGNSTPDSGGGIFNSGNDATLTITNSTITGNSRSAGGGIYSSATATVTARNTLIALNTAPTGPDVNGELTSQGFNLIGNPSGATITPNPPPFPDQIGVTAAELNLGPLRDNGGPTKTHALLAPSRAIDKGHSSGSTADQRGFTRPVDIPGIPNAAGGDGADIGAFEVQPPAPPTVLGNISTRLRVETGDDVLIGGFIVTGTQPKKVIVRAIGPSLTTFPDHLANPTLELRDGNGGLVRANDDWRIGGQEAEIIATTIPPTNDLESAIVATLPANNAGYTAIVRGVNNGTGVAVVEAYDLDRSVDSKLANISTRGLVQTGDNVLIAGTIILGQASQKVIVRAIGPSLMNVPGKMADPTLELRDGNGGLVRANDNWRTGGQEAEIIATTIPPTNDLESAIVETLPANGASYTAIVRGVNNTTGIAVVEVYAIQ